MTERTDLLRREHKAADHIYFKEFAYGEPQGDNDSENRTLIDYLHYIGLYQGATHDARLFIKELGKKIVSMILESVQKTTKSTLALMSDQLAAVRNAQ